MILFKNFPENVSEDEQAHISKFVLNNFNTAANKNYKQPENNDKFVEAIRNLQKKKGISDEELAFKSNFTPEDLENLLTKQNSIPSRNVCYALAVGLETNKEEFLKIIKSIGYESIKDDMSGLVTAYFLDNKEFDIFKINRVLFNYDVKPLGL